MCDLLQEDSVKVGKVTAAGMYFLGFPVYRFEQNNLVSLEDQLGPFVVQIILLWIYPFISSNYIQAAAAKDSDGAFFKRLDSFQPCDIHELKPGTHFFAVYGILLLYCCNVS